MHLFDQKKKISPKCQCHVFRMVMKNNPAKFRLPALQSAVRAQKLEAYVRVNVPALTGTSSYLLRCAYPWWYLVHIPCMYIWSASIRISIGIWYLAPGNVLLVSAIIHSFFVDISNTWYKNKNIDYSIVMYSYILLSAFPDPSSRAAPTPSGCAVFDASAAAAAASCALAWWLILLPAEHPFFSPTSHPVPDPCSPTPSSRAPYGFILSQPFPASVFLVQPTAPT